MTSLKTLRTREILNKHSPEKPKVREKSRKSIKKVEKKTGKLVKDISSEPIHDIVEEAIVKTKYKGTKGKRQAKAENKSKQNTSIIGIIPKSPSKVRISALENFRSKGKSVPNSHITRLQKENKKTTQSSKKEVKSGKEKKALTGTKRPVDKRTHSRGVKKAKKN